jgi:L-2-hydroxyglutarate oxidase LhgO
MSTRGEAVVIGGGVVGLAVAAALARDAWSVSVLERREALAREITTRNSGVLHAGLYYPADSRKARFCARGRALLYERCARLRIPHRRTGKLVVATRDEEVATLERLHALGNANGAPGLALIDGAEVARREPAVRAVAALLSPDTGIVDPEALALSFAAEAEAHGATLVCEAEVTGIEQQRDGFVLGVRRRDGATETQRARVVVNAAGLRAQHIAALAGFDVDARAWRLHLCKGDYFSLAPAAPLPLTQLVYPVPAVAGLGIHATLDLAGRVRFGPDAEYVAHEHYEVDPAKAEHFAEAIRRYLPEIDAQWLAPDYAGIRPKLAGPGEAFRDFEIDDGASVGRPGFVNLLGIESPGLTASPAIAEHVAALLRDR